MQQEGGGMMIDVRYPPPNYTCISRRDDWCAHLPPPRLDMMIDVHILLRGRRGREETQDRKGEIM